MADNSGALRRARRQQSRSKRQRAIDAIGEVEESADAITFPAVARRAGVSVSMLYANKELAARIATARDRQRQAGRDRAWQLPARSLVTEQSLRTEVANAKDQTRRLVDEVTILRDRLARQLGAEADIARGHVMSPLLDQLEHRAAELEADNDRLRRRVQQLEDESRELHETLEAARAMNRELMSEVNRAATKPGRRNRPASSLTDLTR